jgi:hypothetical protein
MFSNSPRRAISSDGMRPVLNTIALGGVSDLPPISVHVLCD